MSSGNAIIARMGLDLSGMRKDLTESEKLMIQSTMRTTKAMTAASRDGSKERHEATHGGKSGNARSLGDLINLATGGSGAVSELSTATHLLGVSAVAAATAIGGAALIEKIYEVGSAARDLHRELEALTHSQSGPDFSSMDALKKHLEEVRVISEKVKLPGTGGKSEWEQHLQLSGQFFKDMGTSFFNVFAKGDLGGLVKVENDREAEKTKAAKERNITLASIAAKEQRIADIARLSLNIGEHAADLAKIETDFAEKRGALYAEQAEHPEEDHTGQIRALQDEEATARKAAERKFQDKQREVALARELTSIKARGEDVATGTTAADMRDAQKAFDIAPEEEKAAALAKLDAAKLAHFEAVKATKEHREQLRIATDIADMQASADIKHFAELEQQRVELQRQLSTAKPDEKLELAGKISANAAEYRAALAAYSDKTFDLASTMVDATTGRGQAEQLRNMEAKIGLAQAHRAALDYNPAADPKEKADAEAKINELVKARFEFVAGFERQMRDINDQRELAEITIGEAVNKTLTVKRQIELMERQIIANTREAQTADELRTAELKKQNTELANQITKLKTVRALETPAEKQERHAHERLVRRKLLAASAREKDHADTQRRKAGGIGYKHDPEMYGPSALDAALQPRLNFKAALNKPAETAGAATADNLQAALDKSKATTHLENIARDIKGVRSAR